MSKTYTIAELREMTPIDRSTFYKARRAAEAEIDYLEQKKNQADIDYQLAFQEKDVEAMSQAKARKATINALIEEKTQEIESTKEALKCDYSREDVKESWNKYVSGINKTINPKIEKFLALRKEMADLFLEIAELQRQATIDICHVNRLYSETTPGDDSLFSCDSDLDRPGFLQGYNKQHPSGQKVFTLPGVHGVITYRDVCHEDQLISALIAAGCIDRQKEQDLISVIDYGKPVRDPLI